MVQSSNGEAAHEFGALNTLLLVVILGLCILSAYLIKKNSLYYLPESAVAIMVGVVVGGMAKLVYPSVEELNFLSFEPELFFFLLLPPIIFEAGYSLKKKEFFANFWTISLYTVFGTLISTFVIGFLVYWAGLMGMVDIDTSSPMEALVFGSLISAVDPVATLSIMGNPELNCEPLLYSLVFGESVLNDAVAIVLFKTFMSSYEAGQEFSAAAMYGILSSFVFMSLGSVAVGVLIGLLCSYLCKHTMLRLYPEYEVSLLFLFAYGSYAFSEALSLSGIMSLFFNGIVLSHYNSYNLSPISQVTAHNIFKSLAVLSEYFVFLYIGMGIFTGRFKHFHLAFCAFCIVTCLLGRAANIFPLSLIANLGRSRRIPVKMQLVMWFAGLRGAIAFALSQNMPLEHRELYVSTTLLIVIGTTMTCGALTEPMLSYMGMRIDKTAATQTGTTSSSGSSTSNISSSPAHTVSADGGGPGGLIGALTGLFNRTLALRSQGVEMVPDRSRYEVCTDEGADIEDRSSHPLTAGYAANGNDHSSNSNSSMIRNSSDPEASPMRPSSGSARRTFAQSFEAEIMSPIFGGPRRKPASSPSPSPSGEEDDADLHCTITDIMDSIRRQEGHALEEHSGVIGVAGTS